MTKREESLKFNQYYRPDKFADIIGQSENLKILDNSILTNQVQNAYIFYGEPGVGKTTVGRVFANKLICLSLDENNEPCGTCDACIEYNNNPYTAGVIEIDGASNATINEIRALKNGVKYSPKYDKNIVIIDEAQDVKGPGASALLKVLEEPPAHTIFILITTDYMSILPAIRSRCTAFYFQSVSSKDIKSRLLKICLEQNIKITEKALEYISEGVSGCVRDGVKILQQAAIAGNNNIKEKHLKNLVDIEAEYINQLLYHTFNTDTAEMLSYLNSHVSNVTDKDFDFIIKFLRNTIIVKKDISSELKISLIQIANIFLRYKSDLSLYPNNKIALEFACVEVVSYIEQNINNKEYLNNIFKTNEFEKYDSNLVTIDKKELFLNMLYISNPKSKGLLEHLDISLGDNGTILKFLTNTEEEKNELRKILSSKTPQKIKPFVHIDGFIVKQKDDN